MGKNYKNKKDYIGCCYLCGVKLSKNNKCKSHIIPKFEYKRMRGNDKRKLYMIRELENNSRSQWGYYTDKILCRTCDGGRISQLDEAAKKFLNTKYERDAECEELLLFRNSRYSDIFLFVLSVIFRASADNETKDPTSSKTLSKRHQNMIRKMLNGEMSIDQNIFKVNITKYTSGEYLGGIGVMPGKSVNVKFKNRAIWSFSMGEGFVFYLSVNPDRELLLKYKHLDDFQKDKGCIVVLDDDDFDSSIYFNEIIIPILMNRIK